MTDGVVRVDALKEVGGELRPVEHFEFENVEEFEHAQHLDHEGRVVHRFVVTLEKEPAGKVTR